MESLSDPNNDLYLHVRHLVILDYIVGVGMGLSDEVGHEYDLNSMISRLRRLQYFRYGNDPLVVIDNYICRSWYIESPIPDSLLAKLEHYHPDVKLLVGSYNQPIIGTRLFSSPSLYALGFCILNHFPTSTASRQLKQCSRLPELREVLLRSPNLRRLDIMFGADRISSSVNWLGDTASPHILCLPLRPSDRLPPLQELIVSGNPQIYEFTLEHCQQWKQCMDWSQLRRLDLGMSCPQHFFEQFRETLPNLRSLTMGIRTGDRPRTHLSQGPLTCNRLATITQFMEYNSEVHELNITDFDTFVGDICMSIWLTYRSLRKLYYHASIDRKTSGDRFPFLYTWNPRILEGIGLANPDLQELTIDFPYPEGHWPVEHAQIIAKFSRLNKLKIYIELGSEASDFAAVYHQDRRGRMPFPPLNLDAAVKAITYQFKIFFTHNASSRLRSMEVCFLRSRYGNRFQNVETESIVKIERLERDDAPSPLDGG
ncbi:MAG: hypothetical protein Q9172_007673, partial [Xanthocarpia lactea]